MSDFSFYAKGDMYEVYMFKSTTVVKYEKQTLLCPHHLWFIFTLLYIKGEMDEALMFKSALVVQILEAKFGQSKSP